jgi:DNA-binding response OmpR family regulator
MSAPCKVLIVDDEPNLCRILEAKLRRNGCNVDTAHVAASAWPLLLANRYAVVFLDLRLPDGDGLDLLPRFKSIAPNTAFVTMTAYEEPDLTRRCIQAGADQVLFKPFELDHLIEIVHTHTRNLSVTLDTEMLQRVAASGRAVVVHVPNGEGPHEYPARIAAADVDGLHLDGLSSREASAGQRVEVTIPGGDALYSFESEVLEPEEEFVRVTRPQNIERRQRRRHPRTALHGLVKISRLTSPESPSEIAAVAGDPQIMAMICDVSLGGMTVASPAPFARDEEVHLRWSLTKNTEDVPIEADGKVLRADTLRADGLSPLYRVAVQFTTLLPAAYAALSELSASLSL